jgi:phosphotransacetylase
MNINIKQAITGVVMLQRTAGGERNNFKAVLDYIKSRPKQKVAVVCAADEAVLKSAEIARGENILDFIFFDNADKIKKAADTYKVDISGIEIVNTASDKESAILAAKAVRDGIAQILMKGHLSTGMFLKAVLDKESGLRKSKLLSHIQVFECPVNGNIKMISDGGMNLYPGYEEFCHITANAIDAFYKICGRSPKTALISAYNRPDPLLKSSIAMAAVSGDLKIYIDGSPAPISGPVTLDVAISPEAAEKKDISLNFDGPADILIVPNIETGNLLGKSLSYFTDSQSAGIICGTSKPVIMLSRADNFNTKLNSMALGALLSIFN